MGQGCSAARVKFPVLPSCFQVSKNGLTNSVFTLYELASGDDTENEGKVWNLRCKLTLSHHWHLLLQRLLSLCRNIPLCNCVFTSPVPCVLSRVVRGVYFQAKLLH